MKLTSISKAPIRISALEMNDVYGSESDVKSNLLNHYKESARKNILTIWFSSDLLGNPSNLAA